MRNSEPRKLGGMKMGETRKDSLLRLINNIGGEGRHRDFCEKIRDYWELNEEEKRNEKKLFHHVASIEQALKTSEFVILGGGIWKITREGKKYLSSKSYESSVSSGGPAEHPTAEDSDLVIKLRNAQRNNVNYTIFEETLTEAFNTLGFSAKHLGKQNEPDILLEILNHKIVVNAKTTNTGVISPGHVDFDAEEMNKERCGADYVGIVAPGFSEGNIRVTAEKRNVILIETEAICKILQNRELYEPDRIVEILFKSDKYLITPEDITPSSTVEDLVKIIANIMPILKNFEKAGMDSFSKDTLRTALIAQGNIFAINVVETALKFLSTTPFSILQKQNDEYSLTSDFESIQRKIGILRQAFER